MLDDAALLALGAHHVAGGVHQVDDRNVRLAALLDELPGLGRALGGDGAVVADDADRMALDHRAAADGLLVVLDLEVEELGAIDQPRDDLAAIDGLAVVRRHHAADFLDVVERRAHLAQLQLRTLRVPVEALDDVARDADAVGVVLGQELRRAGHTGVHVGAAQILVVGDLAGRGLQQRRAGQEYLGVLADHHHEVRQARHVGAAGGRGAVHDRHLRNAGGGEPALVGEGLAARDEQLGLVEQVGTAGLDHRHHRQLLLQGDLLQAQGLLHAPGGHRTALDRRVAGDHEAARAGDIADAGDHVAAGQRAVLVVVQLVAAERAEFEPGRAAVEHQVQALARQQLLALVEARALAFLLGAALALDLAPVGDELQHALAIGRELGTVNIDLGFDNGHFRPLRLSRCDGALLPARAPFFTNNMCYSAPPWRSPPMVSGSARRRRRERSALSASRHCGGYAPSRRRHWA